MLYKDLVKDIASDAGVAQKDAEKVIAALGEHVVKAARAEGKVRVPALGVFELRVRAAREGRNPQSGKIIKIAESKTIGFKPAAKVKDSIQG